MSVKSDVYLNNLKQHLGINDINEVNEDHAEEILKYINLHSDVEVFKELVKIIPDFISYAKETITNMNKTLRAIINSGVSEVNDLKEIIVQLNKMLENEKLTEKDKDRIFDLIIRFQDTLKEQMRSNAELKKIITKGTIGVGALVTLMIGGYIIYKIVGGKGGEKVVSEAAKQIAEKSLEISTKNI